MYNIYAWTKKSLYLLRGKSVLCSAMLFNDTPYGGTLWLRYSREFVAQTNTPPAQWKNNSSVKCKPKTKPMRLLQTSFWKNPMPVNKGNLKKLNLSCNSINNGENSLTWILCHNYGKTCSLVYVYVPYRRNTNRLNK